MQMQITAAAERATEEAFFKRQIQGKMSKKAKIAAKQINKLTIKIIAVPKMRLVRGLLHALLVAARFLLRVAFAAALGAAHVATTCQTFELQLRNPLRCQVTGLTVSALCSLYLLSKFG